MASATLTPEQTLAAWESDEAAVPRAAGGIGVLRPEQLAGKTYTAVELKINIVWALTEQVPMVRAEELYAHASTTCFIMDAK